MWKCMLFSTKNHLLRCWGRLSLLNWIGAYIISIYKSASKKIGALICSLKFLSPEVALYLSKCTIQSCMECCHVRAFACSCYLEMLDQLQKWICRILVLSLLPFMNPWWNLLKVRCYKMSLSIVSFLAQLHSKLSVYRMLSFHFNYSFFLNRFPVCCNIFFLVTPWFVVAVQPCMEWIPI